MLVAYKRYQEAEPYLKLGTEVSPRAFQLFNLLGRSYLAMDRFEEAEVTIRAGCGTWFAGRPKTVGWRLMGSAASAMVL